MANEFTKQLSEPSVVSAPQLAQPTGSTVADLASLASTGLQAYQFFQNKEAKKEQALLMQEQEAQSALGLNFANDLIASVAQVRSPAKRKMEVRRREAEFLDANRDNPLAMEAYFKTMKGRDFKTSVQQEQEIRLLKEQKAAQYEAELITKGKTLAVGMSNDPAYQDTINKLGDRVPDETYAMLARTVEGQKQLLAIKKAELDYNTGLYNHNKTKNEDATESAELEATNRVVAQSQVKVSELTTNISVPTVLLTVTSSPQERVEAAQVLRNARLKAREDLGNYVKNLSPEDRMRLDVDALYNEFDKRTQHIDAMTDPQKVNSYSDAALEQGTKAFLVGQVIDGSPAGASVGLSAALSIPYDPIAMGSFQSEIRNGSTPFKAMADLVSKIYDGNYTEVKKASTVLGRDFDNVFKEWDSSYTELTASFAVAASNPRNELHDPTTQRTVDKMLEKALETPEGTQQYIQSVEERGQDAVETTMKGFKNYVNGTLAPSLARLRSGGATGVSIELDNKGNIVLTPEAVQVENFANRNPVPNINLGGIAPSVPQQFNVTSARIAREVSTELNKHVDLLSKLMPDVPRATVAQMMLDGTKLAFRAQEEQPKKDNQ